MAPALTAATEAATLKKPLVAEDDFSQQNRNVRQPEMCVDYLSYTFDEMDLAASWRVMTKQKKDVVDGIRLENASWRTWAKQRNNLKTISPQTLNWLKDSDVTWLYGPLHTVIRTEDDPFLNPRVATTKETLGLIETEKKPLKSALKKVTTVELLKKSLNDHPTINTSQDLLIKDLNNDIKAISPVVLANHRQPRLRFNHQVEQCIALVIEDNRGDFTTTDEEEEEDANVSVLIDDDSDSEDEVSYNNQIIKKIAPARLKKSQSDVDTDDVSSVSSTSSSLHNYMTRSPIDSMPSSPCNTSTSQTHNNNPLLIYKEQEQQCTAPPATTTNQHNIHHHRTSTNSSLLSHSYKEKTHIAEPALVTMHQNATDIQSSTNTNLFNNIATWAASYFSSSRPNPQPSFSTSSIPIKSTTSPIPIDRPYYPPTSSNSSSL